MTSASSTLKTQMSRESLLGGALFIFFVLGLPLGLAGAPQAFNDGDVSWHVATGEWILRHQAVPATDPFSFTAGGQPWVAMEWSADVIYADPPYTKRQYAAYYHLLNSIASDVEPPTTGSTGLPDWHPLASDWCYKRRAPHALERLVAKSSAPVVALSYSSDGHIPDSDIRDILGAHGEVEVYDRERRRYRSSTLEHRSDTVLERLYVMSR